jgi:hypothetical protein
MPACMRRNSRSNLRHWRVRIMVLIYENDPLDNEDARGRFYHVCRGRIVRTEIQLPSGESVYECPECGIDLEPEDFWIARQKGSV